MDKALLILQSTILGGRKDSIMQDYNIPPDNWICGGDEPGENYGKYERMIKIESYKYC